MYASSGEPDQTSRFAVSDLSLHCLSMPHKKDASLIWVNPDHVNNLCSEMLSCIQMTTFDQRIEHYEPWSDCSKGNSLICVHIICIIVFQSVKADK